MTEKERGAWDAMKRIAKAGDTAELKMRKDDYIVLRVRRAIDVALDKADVSTGPALYPDPDAIPCPACGATGFTLAGSADQHGVDAIKCRDCGFDMTARFMQAAKD